MSRFKNEITHLQAHIKTLRLGAGALVIVALVMGGGWWSAPRDLTIHVPPDLRSGSTRKWWEVPPESVYAFTFYVFQTLNRWPTNGEEDYARNLHTLSLDSHLPMSCSYCQNRHILLLYLLLEEYICHLYHCLCLRWRSILLSFPLLRLIHTATFPLRIFPLLAHMIG